MDRKKQYLQSMLQVEPLGFASKWKRGGASGDRIAASCEPSSIADDEVCERNVASIAVVPVDCQTIDRSPGTRQARQHLANRNSETEHRRENVIRIKGGLRAECKPNLRFLNYAHCAKPHLALEARFCAIHLYKAFKNDCAQSGLWSKYLSTVPMRRVLAIERLMH
ncbi:hypothetical protein [Pararobbsia alpina]|uniref:hypothetical protein n=1 Tax=Pararobbsia alpina TaxID=621374 RepID=UPI0015840207|nr:hypothetical protein [Pararobbsia alpina]